MIFVKKKLINSLNMIVVALFTSGLISNFSIADSAASIVKIKAKVVAGCILDAPDTVTLTDIPSSEFNKKVTGDYLTNYSKTFDLIASCSGTNKYKYTFTATETDANCIKTNEEFMRYCLQFNDKYLDLSSGSASLERDNAQGGKVTTIAVVPQVGALNNMPVGEVTGQITVTIEPI